MGVAAGYFSHTDTVHLHQLKLNFSSFICKKIAFVVSLHNFQSVLYLLLDPVAFAGKLYKVAEKPHFIEIVLAVFVESFFGLLDLLCFIFEVKLDQVRLNFRTLATVTEMA